MPEPERHAIQRDDTLHRPVSAGLCERLVMQGAFLPLLRRAPGLMRWARPALIRLVWHAATPWRRSLLANGRVLLGPEASDAALRAHGLAVLSNVQQAIDDIVNGGDETPRRLAANLRSFEGVANYLDGRRAARGAIITSIHMGPFEAALAVLRRFESRMHVVFARDALGHFEQLRSRFRDHLDVIEAPIDNGLATWTALRDALARNEIVLMLADRVQQWQPGVPVPFMGAIAKLPTGPIKLAMMTGAPIIPIYCWRENNGLGVRMEPPIFVEPGFERDLANHPAMRALAASMEAAIRERPREWLAVHEVWESGKG